MSASQAEIENISLLSKQVTITLSKPEILKLKKNKLSEYAKRIKLDGFRSGMIPMQILEKRFGKQAINDAVSEIFDATFQKLLKDRSIKPVGNIDFIKHPTAEEPTEINNDLHYVLQFEVSPEINLDNLTKIKLEKPIYTITEEDLNKELTRLQEHFATWQVKEKAAEDADEITIDFKATIDDKEFTGGTASNTKVLIGSKKFIDGFEQGLIGLKANDQKILQLKFPDNYNVKEYANKDVISNVTVKQVAKRVLANLDEGFAVRLGLSDYDLDKIKDKVRSNMQHAVDNAITGHLREVTISKIIETYDLQVPNCLVNEEKKHILAELNNLKNVTENAQLDAAVIETQAAERVKTSLIINEIIVKNKLKLDLNKFKQKIFELTSSGLTNEFLKKHPKQAKQLIEKIKYNVLAENAIDILIANADIVEKKVNFSEIADGSAFKN